MFLPYVKVLPVLAYAIMLAIWVILTKQAWDGRYTSFAKDKVFLPLFEGVGGRMVDLFSVQIEIVDASVHTNDTTSDKTV